MQHHQSVAGCDGPTTDLVRVIPMWQDGDGDGDGGEWNVLLVEQDGAGLGAPWWTAGSVAERLTAVRGADDAAAVAAKLAPKEGTMMVYVGSWCPPWEVLGPDQERSQCLEHWYVAFGYRGSVPGHGRVETCAHLLHLYGSHDVILSPPTLALARRVRHCGADPASAAWPEWGAPWLHAVPPEVAPGLWCVPIASNTLLPFHKTNHIVFAQQGAALIVDPSANDDGQPLLRQVLAMPEVAQAVANGRLSVFVTHEHRDHWHALPLLAQTCPGLTVYASQPCLDAMEAGGALTGTVPSAVHMGPGTQTMVRVGDRALALVAAPGHTEGHVCLWDNEAKVVVAGDHVVGFGSSVLDESRRASMAAYLATTSRLEELWPRIVLPAHGAPRLDAVDMLAQYKAHRLKREAAIHEAYQGGAKSVDALLAAVYPGLPEALWPSARMNIRLYLAHLQQLGKL